MCRQRWWIAVTIFTARCLTLPSRTLATFRKNFIYNRFVNKYERPLLGGWHVSFHFYCIAVLAVMLTCINWEVFWEWLWENEKRFGSPESGSRGDNIIPLVRQGKAKLRWSSSALFLRLHPRTYVTLYRSAGFCFPIFFFTCFRAVSRCSIYRTSCSLMLSAIECLWNSVRVISFTIWAKLRGGDFVWVSKHRGNGKYSFIFW